MKVMKLKTLKISHMLGRLHSAKSVLRLALIFCVLLLCVSILNADEFDEINNVLDRGSTAGKKALGTFLQWAFAVALPLICIFAGAIMGYTQQKKKAEQEQSTTKIYIVTAVSGVAGFFVFAIITMIISRALFGDSNYIFTIINEFYKQSTN